MLVPETMTITQEPTSAHINSNRPHLMGILEETLYSATQSLPEELHIVAITNTESPRNKSALGLAKPENLPEANITPGVAPHENLGGLRLAFREDVRYPTTEYKGATNFILDDAVFVGSGDFSGGRNILRDCARVKDSSLRGSCLLNGAASLENVRASGAVLTGSSSCKDSKVFDSHLAGRAKVANVYLSDSLLIGDFEIDASAMPADCGVLNIRGVDCVEYWVPGQENTAPSDMLSSFYRASVMFSMFSVAKGDETQGIAGVLPYVRACFDPENHKVRAEMCHCLLWLPQMLMMHPAAIQYFVRVSGGSTTQDADYSGYGVADVRKNVWDASLSNPLSSVPLRVLDDMLLRASLDYEEERTVVRRVRGIDGFFEYYMRNNLRVLGVNEEALKVFFDWDSFEFFSHDHIDFIFSSITGVHLGSA